MKTLFLSLLLSSSAYAAPIVNPILPPIDGWPAALNDCVITAFKTASGLEFRELSIVYGPYFAQTTSGSPIKTRAEFQVAGTLTSGTPRSFKMDFLSGDSRDWLLYQDSDHGIGAYGTSLNATAEALDFRSGAYLFEVSIEPCRDLLGE